jgi:hypothetical protein
MSNRFFRRRVEKRAAEIRRDSRLAVAGHAAAWDWVRCGDEWDAEREGMVMRNIAEGFMKRHLAVDVVVDQKTVHNQPIDDPFCTTRTELDIRFSFWERIKLLFSASHRIQIIHHIRGDSVAMKRWFAGQDGCDWCGATIGYPHDGSSAADPGYHHGDERLCETCYYKPESKAVPATASEGCDQMTTASGRSY